VPAVGSMERATTRGSVRLVMRSSSPVSPLRSRMSAVAVPVVSPDSRLNTSAWNRTTDVSRLLLPPSSISASVRRPSTLLLAAMPSRSQPYPGGKVRPPVTPLLSAGACDDLEAFTAHGSLFPTVIDSAGAPTCTSASPASRPFPMMLPSWLEMSTRTDARSTSARLATSSSVALNAPVAAVVLLLALARDAFEASTLVDCSRRPRLSTASASCNRR
jgi:hypothetical protein